MVDDLEGNTFGYIGLAFIDWDKSAGEADSVVRGARAEPGLMTEVLRTLLTWARGQLGLETIGVRVRSDNPALTFYEKFGFREIERVPLVRSERDNMIVWSEDPGPRAGIPGSAPPGPHDAARVVNKYE